MTRVNSVTKEKAILQFAEQMVDKKGKFTNEEIAEIKKAGVNDQEMLEIVLVVTLTIFSNYFNYLTDSKIDPTSI